MNWLRRQWLRLWRWLRPGPAPWATAHVEELPDDPRPRTVYLAGEGPYLWSAAMLCPCGCGETIRLNLLREARPCWAVERHPDGTVSIEPSVWRRLGCRSHFFLRRGRVEWCRSSSPGRGR